MVADKLLVCTLALRPTVTLLGKHFKASKLDDSGMNLLDWSRDDISPLLRCVDRYFHLLSQPGHDHWKALWSRGWPRKTEHLAVTCHAHMAAALMLRCWDPLQHWPFRGMKVTRAFPAETREAISEEWKRSCECCSDGFSKSYTNVAFDCEEPEGVLEGNTLESLEHTYGALPVNNLQTEDPHCDNY